MSFRKKQRSVLDVDPTPSFLEALDDSSLDQHDRPDSDAPQITDSFRRRLRDPTYTNWSDDQSIRRRRMLDESFSFRSQASFNNPGVEQQQVVVNKPAVAPHEQPPMQRKAPPLNAKRLPSGTCVFIEPTAPKRNPPPTSPSPKRPTSARPTVRSFERSSRSAPPPKPTIPGRAPGSPPIALAGTDTLFDAKGRCKRHTLEIVVRQKQLDDSFKSELARDEESFRSNRSRENARSARSPSGSFTGRSWDSSPKSVRTLMQDAFRPLVHAVAFIEGAKDDAGERRAAAEELLELKQREDGVLRIQASVRSLNTRMDSNRRGVFTARQASEPWRWRPTLAKPSIWRATCEILEY